MPIKSNQLSTEIQYLSSLAASPTSPGAGKGLFYPKTFGAFVDACFMNNNGLEIRLTTDGVVTGEANTLINATAGTGAGLLAGTKVGQALVVKKIKAGSSKISVVSGTNDVTIDTTLDVGETNTASNATLGTGAGLVFKEKNGLDFVFKKLLAGQNIDVVNGPNDITISVSNLAQNVYTASNVGTGQGNIWKAISNNDIQFKRLQQGDNITLMDNGNEIIISAVLTSGSGEANTASNAGVGVGLVKAKVGVNLPFKSLIAGTGVAFTSSTDEITIGLSGGTGEANTASNSTAGTGTGLIFKGKSGVDLVFKKILAGSNITITDGTDDITIASTGGGSAPSDTAYDPTSWDGVTTIAPSKNAIRDKVFSMDASILTATNHAAALHAPAGAEANPTTVSNAEAVAGTITTIRSWTPARVKEAIIALAPSGGGSSLSTYTASATSGDECVVTATGAGISYARSGDIGTFTIPVGVTLLSFMIRVPGAAITGSKFVINHGQGSSIQALGFPPILQVYADGATNAVAATASAKATDTGLAVGLFNQSLISTLTNGSAYRIRGAF